MRVQPGICSGPVALLLFIDVRVFSTPSPDLQISCIAQEGAQHVSYIDCDPVVLCEPGEILSNRCEEIVNTVDDNVHLHISIRATPLPGPAIPRRPRLPDPSVLSFKFHQ